MKTISILLFLFIYPNFKETTDVYICNSGKAQKYHYKSNCKGLSSCGYKIVEITLENAKKDGKTLCGWEK
ncbi:hypothetical protein [Pedobacter nototheniae]|uniref:hypothetical protein n=1 Tax=Pedobacter nototheniae TaxID=2488994 RepID=UPI00293139B0|nr:hypothetical protein [Pedobacter nototheniae]